MRPLRLYATNYGPYRSVEWCPQTGLTAILGRNAGGDGISSNGAGKTKLLEILPIALYGPRMPWTEYLTLGTVEEKCTVEVEFEYAGDVYCVRRTFDPRGKGKTTTEVDRSDPEGDPYPWESLTRESQAETQQVIDALLGMGEETFSHSVFATQGSQHFADPSLTPAQRKAVLSEALGLDIWDRYLTAATERRKAVERELDAPQVEHSTAEELDVAERAVARHEDAVASLEQEIAALEEGLEQRRRENESVREAAAARREAQTAVDAARATHARYEQLTADADTAQTQAARVLAEIEEQRELADRIPDLETELEAARAYDRNVAERKRLLEQARSQSASAHSYRLKISEVEQQIGGAQEALAATCDRCGQRVDGAARETLVASLERDLTLLETSAQTAEQEAANLVVAADALVADGPAHSAAEVSLLLTAARESDKAIERLGERYETLQAMVARANDPEFRQEAQDALDEYRRAVSTLEALPGGEPELYDIRADEDSLKLKRDQLTLFAASRGANEQRLATMRESYATHQEQQERLAALRGELDDLKFMERMYGRDGIPALLLESMAIPQIEAEAQRVLSELGTGFHVELRTQRDLKSRDGKKETLDVIVNDGTGERSYASFSGGERTRVNLALRIGLARLIASRKGAHVRTLCLDEPEFLDAEGLRRLPDVLRSLTEFDTILLISHDEVLSDLCDQTVTVVRDGDWAELA